MQASHASCLLPSPSSENSALGRHSHFAFVVNDEVIGRYGHRHDAVVAWESWFKDHETSAERMAPLRATDYKDGGWTLPMAMYMNREVAWVESVPEDEDEDEDDDDDETTEESRPTELTAVAGENAATTAPTVQSVSQSYQSTIPPQSGRNIPVDQRVPCKHELTGALLLAPMPAGLCRRQEQEELQQQQENQPASPISSFDLPPAVIERAPQSRDDNHGAGSKRSRSLADFNDLLNDDDVEPVTKRRTKRPGKTLEGYAIFSRQRVVIYGRN